MAMRSGPQNRQAGNLDASSWSTVTRKATDQPAIGPSGVRLQSKARTLAPMSPPPDWNAEGPCKVMEPRS